jgi:hypothetical protein
MYEKPIVDISRRTPNYTGRVTVLICTPDSNGARFRLCYGSVMATTQGEEYDLRIMDNRKHSGFSHQTELNKALDNADGVLITLDDDVIVAGNWYRNLLAQIGAGVGMVSCSSSDPLGNLRTRGATFNKEGVAKLWRGHIDAPISVPCTGSFCCAFNVPLWPSGLRFSHEYNKYCFDPDMCFRLWEHELSTITIPDVVIHDSGGAMRDLGIDRAPLFARDQLVFKRIWINTGRLAALYAKYSDRWPEPLRAIQ